MGWIATQLKELEQCGRHHHIREHHASFTHISSVPIDVPCIVSSLFRSIHYILILVAKWIIRIVFLFVQHLSVYHIERIGNLDQGKLPTRNIDCC